jgi:hypothetical protein
LFFNQCADYYKKIKIRNNKIIIVTNNDNICIALFKVLSNVLTKCFIGQIKRQYRNSAGKPIQYSKNFIHFQFLQADPSYIHWCIENVKKFYIEPTELELLKSKPCKYFSHFELSRILDNVFSYKPIFIELKYNLPEKATATNSEKFSFRNRPTNGSNEQLDYQEEESIYCSSCHESPCMCSDREESSSIHDF